MYNQSDTTVLCVVYHSFMISRKCCTFVYLYPTNNKRKHQTSRYTQKLRRNTKDLDHVQDMEPWPRLGTPDEDTRACEWRDSHMILEYSLSAKHSVMWRVGYAHNIISFILTFWINCIAGLNRLCLTHYCRRMQDGKQTQPYPTVVRTVG